MWSKKQRARRIAAVRRQLAEICVGRPSNSDYSAPMDSLECGGRGHLISAASWLIAGYQRALQAGRSRNSSRADYLFAFRRNPGAGRDTAPREKPEFIGYLKARVDNQAR
jgi:hypothetical protein